MLTWLFYLLMLIGVPLIFCLLIYRLKGKMPNGNIVIPIVMGVIAFQTILPLPFYVVMPIFLDSSYELFRTFLLIIVQYYIYGIITIGVYVIYYILTKRSKKFIISIIAFTLIITILLCVIGRILFKERENYNNLYLKMEQIDKNDSLIGKTKEDVIKTLGEPLGTYEYEKTGEEVYTYDAGIKYVGIVWGDINIATTKHYYTFRVEFNKEDKVQDISMKEEP